MLPQLQQDYQANSGAGPYLKMGVLNQTHFPNRCGGWCGCDGAVSRGPSQLMAHNDSHAHFLSGRQGPESQSHLGGAVLRGPACEAVSRSLMPCRAVGGFA